MLIAGVDEAGRGPLAGPVYAAAVILDPKQKIEGLADSKILTAEARERLYQKICERALAYSIAKAEVAEIDKLNILQATLLAMRRAVEGLTINPDKVLVDGNQAPKISYPLELIIGGDAIVPAISAASILAKVARDREMREWDIRFPGYGFSKHKGYATKEHYLNLQKLGPTVIHRAAFRPVKELLEAGSILIEAESTLLETGSEKVSIGFEKVSSEKISVAKVSSTKISSMKVPLADAE